MKLEDIRRKIRIRKETYQNMIGQDAEYSMNQLTSEERNILRKEAHCTWTHMDEYGCQKVYGPIDARNKWTLFIKKIIRKIFYKSMGWYYVPMIEGQVQFNRQSKQIAGSILQLMDAQQEEMEHLKKRLKKLEKEGA